MSSIIDPALAKSLIQEFQKQNAAPGGPALMTVNDQYLNGYYIDRQSLEAILADAKFTGISVYLAKQPDSVGAKENKFTIVFAGAEVNPKFNKESFTESVSPYINSGNMYEYTTQCPPGCGSIGDPGGH